MKIFLELPNKNVFAFKVSNNEKIFNLKYAINKLFGRILQNYVLTYEDRILDDDKMFYESKIEEKSLINVDRCEDMIFVERNHEKLLGLKLENLTVSDLMRRIQEKIGIVEDDQILIYENVVLEGDGKLLRECGISGNSVIRVLDRSRGEMQIYLCTLDGRTYDIFVQISDRIIDMKYKLQEKTGWSPDEQKLVYQGKELSDDERTIDEYGICERSVIDVVARLSGEMLIYAKTVYGTVRIEVQKSDKIIDIKHKIHMKTGFLPDEQKLVYQGKPLENDILIGQYGICDGDVINVTNQLRGGGMEIFVKIIYGGTISIGLTGSERIIDIKKQIQEKLGLHRDEQILVYQGGILDDERTIGEYEISNQSTIDFVSISNDKILIFAEIINQHGKTLTFTMPINSTIADLKNEIIAKLGLTKIDEILIYHDNILDDDNKSINQYQSNMILRLTIRTKYDKSFTIDLSKHDKIREIMKSIKTKLEIHKKYEKIIFNNKQLLTNNDNVEVVYSYEIVPRSIIDLDCGLREFRLFIRSIKSGSLDDVKQHFQKKFLEKNHGSYLRFPIHYTVRYGHLEIINYLINQQCNMESVDFENIKPIHYVCLYGTGDILKRFIEYKCYLESSDMMKRRPIHFACYSGNIEIINLLIENGCELEIKNLLNQTPLKIARRNKFIEFSQILEEEILKRKIEKITAAMNLKRANECDQIEITSFFQTLLTKKFDKSDKMGKGSFGKVYKCQESFTGQTFAVKKVNQITDMNKYIELNINNFTTILNHPRIIKYFGAVEKNKKLFIFMELMSGNSLKVEIKSRITSPKVIRYTKQMVEALKFLHENNIIHRDIKPENSLLDDEDNLKLVDFGLSLMLTKNDEFTEKAVTFCGTKEYMAPEILNNDLYTCSVDIWSLGVSVIYMATGKLPLFKIFPSIKMEYQIPDSLPAYFKDLVDKMLIPDPEKRISAENILNQFERFSSSTLY